MNRGREDELINVAIEWDQAMVQNDSEAIERYMADDWIIIGPDGSVSSKEQFLALVKEGTLTHDVMESHDIHVRVYGDTAVLIARGISGGKFNGQSFYLKERVSCVFVRINGEWKCVSTHISALSE